MEKKGKLELDEMLSDSQMVDKTLNNMKISNEDVLKSDTNLNIQAVFNSVLGAPESDMAEENTKGPITSLDDDDEEGKATVVLDINAMKAELEASNQTPDVDLSFGGDDGGLSIGSLDGGSSLEMDSLEGASAETNLDDGGAGMDIDLSMGDMEITGTDTGSVESSAAPGMEIEGGLDLSSELGALENSSGQIVEEEEEPMVLSSDNNDALAADINAGMDGDLNDSFSEPPTMLGQAEEELEVSPPDSGLEDLGFSMSSSDSDEAETPSTNDNLFDPLEEDRQEQKASSTLTDIKRTQPKELKKASPPPVMEVPDLPEMESEDHEDMFAPPVPEVAAKAPARQQAARQTQAVSNENRDREYATHQDYVAHHDDELMKLSATIRGLRDDRQQLLDKINKLEDERKNTMQDNMTMRAELDEKKIEVSLIKKRHNDDLNHLRYQLNLTEDKRVMLEEKNKILRQEFDKLAGKVRVDFNRIQAREKELENQLELLKADSEVQIRHRDSKILDLKRKIDTLEFDMENIVIKESQSKNLQGELEAKLDKTIKTLRNAINNLESEDESLQKFELLKKKSMDI